MGSITIEKMQKTAVILAGGNGSRMNQLIPKQFLLLAGKPIIYYSIKAFFDAYNDFRVILVLPESSMEAGQSICYDYFPGRNITFKSGGETRFHSVQNGIKELLIDDIILVHDAVRCLVSPSLIRRCCDEAIRYGSAIPVIPSDDSIRYVSEIENKIIDRQYIRLVQTPQAFQGKILLPALRVDYKPEFTDEASVVEAWGIKTHLITGEQSNFKITRPMDLLLAEQILASTT